MFGIQGREDLAEESPAEHGAEQKGKPARRHPRGARDEHPHADADERIGDIRDSAVESDPGEIGSHRPAERCP
jgi:hypothetical protein